MRKQIVLVGAIILLWSATGCSRSPDNLNSPISAPDPRSYALEIDLPPELVTQSEAVSASHAIAETFIAAYALWAQSNFILEDQRMRAENLLESSRRLDTSFTDPMNEWLIGNTEHGLPVLVSQRVLAWVPSQPTSQDPLRNIEWESCFVPLPHAEPSTAVKEEYSCLATNLIYEKGTWKVGSVRTYHR